MEQTKKEQKPKKISFEDAMKLHGKSARELDLYSDTDDPFFCDLSAEVLQKLREH